MRILPISFIIFLFTIGAAAEPARRQFTVNTPSGGVSMERFENCAKPDCPVVVILSGSKGFGAPAYNEIGQTFRAAGLNAYLVHVLSTDDIHAIAAASSARARIAYYAKRLPEWTSAVQSVITYLKVRNAGNVGILGISLGAQIASVAAAGRNDIDALVLVDGGFPNGYSQPVRSLPPLLLIWGSDDTTFPLRMGRAMQRTAERLGGPVELKVFDGGTHDFFLKNGTQSSQAAHLNAAAFLASHLSR